MKPIRILVLAALLVPALPAQAQSEEWPAFGHALTLVHLFVRIAAESETPTQSLRAIDEVLLGRNAAANEAVAGLVKEMLADVPPQHRATIAAIGRDLAAVARKNLGVKEPSVSRLEPLQARKDLTAMGLRYHDERDFLDAVKRNDEIAVQLFIQGRGVNLDAKTWTGRSALEIARDNGNNRIADLLARSRP